MSKQHPYMDDDAMKASLELVGRTGATGFEVGYLNDEPPHLWYAHAQYNGTRITVENHVGPIEAVEALARRLLIDGKCMHCHRPITLADHITGHCRWTRNGAHWERGCSLN